MYYIKARIFNQLLVLLGKVLHDGVYVGVVPQYSLVLLIIVLLQMLKQKLLQDLSCFIY
jgi:hypothetical protein